VKKLIWITMLGLIAVIGLPGCSGSPMLDAGFTEVEEGVYTCLDTQTSPLPQGGIKIDVVQGTGGYVKFTVTDDAGNETVDFYKFTPADATMHRYRYVAAMGMKYNYYFDYAAMNLTRVTDASDADVSEALKEIGRWDSAAAETKEHAESLITYFESNFGMSMAEAVSE
jgi:hypothetical protein